MYAFLKLFVSKILTVLAVTFVVMPSVQVAAAPNDKFDALCSRLIGGRAVERFRSRIRQTVNFSMETALRQKLGDDWRQDLLKSQVLDWGQKNLSNAELAYLTAERKHVVTAVPVKKLSLSQNPRLTDIKIVKNFLEVLGGKIEDLDISNLTLTGDPAYEEDTDQEDAESYFRMHDFLSTISQINPMIRKLSISHLNGRYLGSLRGMAELVELDIHNSHFRTPLNDFSFRRPDPSGSISTQRWRTFLMSPPPKLKMLIVPLYFNNADENLLQAEALAAQAGIELIKRNNFSDVRFNDTEWASLQNQKIALEIDGRRTLVGLLSTILPPANADNMSAKKIHQAVSNFIFWHLSAAHEIGLANVQYLEDGSLYANVKYRIGSTWYSLARELQRIGIPYSQRKAVSLDEWRQTSWDYFYAQNKAKVDHWSRVSP